MQRGHMGHSMISEIIENRYSYHAPKGDQAERYVRIRDAAKVLAHVFNELVPASREQVIAFEHLETAVMWANAGIARNE